MSLNKKTRPMGFNREELDVLLEGLNAVAWPEGFEDTKIAERLKGRLNFHRNKLLKTETLPDTVNPDHH